MFVLKLFESVKLFINSSVLSPIYTVHDCQCIGHSQAVHIRVIAMVNSLYYLQFTVLTGFINLSLITRLLLVIIESVMI